MPIHVTAVVDHRAAVDSTAEIGPYVVIEGLVHIGPRTRVYPHAYITGWTRIGADCQIHPGVVVGGAPQDLAYDGAETYCLIGDGTIIREGASVHRGTPPGSQTVVGKNCFIMANAHIAHNCRVGDNVKMANGALLAGHVEVGDGTFISGGATIHQFVRIGELVMIAGLTRIAMDVPPYFTAVPHSCCAGVNLVGLRRAGFTREQREDVRGAYRILYRSGTPFRDAVEALAAAVTTDAGRRILEFLRAPSQRGFCGGRRRGRDADLDGEE